MKNGSRTRGREHTIIRMTKQGERENERMDEFMDYKWLVLNVSAVFPLCTPMEEPAKSIGSFVLAQWTPRVMITVISSHAGTIFVALGKSHLFPLTFPSLPKYCCCHVVKVDWLVLILPEGKLCRLGEALRKINL
ncbi:hypothetical protein GOODEAATRI_013523 [Goodea atripinnis]|uniref:Uncharacterized protein n=1 Tax=Goodea atripinnis TaxID=208336 RepID=A0ABV0MHI4_9TELE